NKPETAFYHGLLGVISLARRVTPGCIADDKLRYFESPFEHIPSPFRAPKAIEDSEVADAEGAIHMDFGNYTIGRLIADRGNYDDQHPTYQAVRRQIEARIVKLGYSASRFKNVDKDIAEETWRTTGRHRQPKIDRYGKKYSWIAYFEMYGLLSDQGQLAEEPVTERISDADIDPSFPLPPRTWRPILPKLFKRTTREPKEWISRGPTPDYDHLLNPTNVDRQRGPWALLEGFIEQSAPRDDRRIFTFLRGVFVNSKQTRRLLSAFNARKYPGNHAIPEPTGDYYTYGGEIPWSDRFGSNIRGPNGEVRRDEREAFEHHDGSQWKPGIPVEIPVCRFAWESYHSQLNQVSGIEVPAPALCQHFGLVNRRGEWDLYDAKGHLATAYRKFEDAPVTLSTQLIYIRCDLLADYLEKTRQTLVWLLWGERGVHHPAGREFREGLGDLFRRNLHIHHRGGFWTAKVRSTIERKPR
ncbi:MAG: hypothetical protein Q7R41_06400, partial [Phycisphaerales bacterium]|nr:hypothetical protein [Phycisphaerales bacterium]